MASLPPVPEYAVLSSKQEINYVCNLKDDPNLTLKFIRDKKVVIMLNCNSDGSLVDLTLTPTTKTHPWVKLTGQIFNINGQETYVPVCKTCNNCADTLSRHTLHSILAETVCIHTKVCANIIRDFDNCWLLDGALSLENDDPDEDRVEIFYQKSDKSRKTQHLAVTITKKNEISILATVGKQTVPKCYSCSSPKCSHFRLWREAFERESHVDDGEDEEETVDEDSRVHYLNQERDMINQTPIPFPLQRDEFQKHILDQKFNGTFTYPEEMIPVYSPQNHCKHGFLFQSNDHLLVQESTDIIVHTEDGSQTYKVKVFKRRSLGPCSTDCFQKVDGHPWLLLHLGGGSFVCYLTLNKWFISFLRSGVTTRSYHKTIEDNCKTTGREFSLKWNRWLEATNAFKANIEIDYDSAFTCIRCHGEPSYITCDGKALAPLKKKLIPLNLSELSSHKNDNEVLEQGSHHKDRVFLSSKSERKIFTKLLVGEETLTDFLANSTGITSVNGKLLLEDIERLGKPSKNRFITLTFLGSDRSSRSHNLCPSVRVISCLEHSNLHLYFPGLRSVLGLF